MSGKRMSRRVLVVLVVLVSAGVGGWYWYVGGAEAGKSGDMVDRAMETAEPREAEVAVVIEAPAWIEPYRRQIVRSSVGGRVLEVAVVGAEVDAGDALVTFDDADARRLVNRAVIDLEEAALNLQRAQHVLDRARREASDVEELYRAGGASREQLENGREAVATAEFSLKSVELTLRKAENSRDDAELILETSTIRASWSGVVLSVEVERGDLVGSSSNLLTLADLSRVRVSAEVDEFDVGRVKAGMPVNVRVEAIAGSGAGPFNTEIAQVTPAAEVVSNIPVFTVWAILENPEMILRPGMSADMTISVAREFGLIVPSRAVTTVRNRNSVDIVPRDPQADGPQAEGLDSDRHFETVQVITGATDGIMTIIREGLEPTDRVVMPAAPAAFVLPAGGTPPADANNSVIPMSVPGTGGGGGSGGGGGGGGTRP